ncbi:serine/threonine protein kinase [Streptomyces sp. YU58]|uniref:serine/threonine protein kinase n=1 Tax=Streptomyces sp. SX92 TaxID=3158972 RepID=UPI0027B8D3A2|nr:serine/threonine protein kinase [Streptomyces coralus]WLW58609.1 protein kinase [Streptomyces coralus]
MGRVWRAADEILDRQVAVKEMRIDGLDAEDARTRRERTLREARATARIDHPNVVRIYDVVDEGERLWIVMELVSGRSLERIMAEDGPLGPRETAHLGLGLVEALRQVHARGVLHRDIKPGNVLVEHGGRRIVLTDFGIAAMQDAKALTMVGMLVGSPDYMAPERVSGRPQGPPSDVWSLGATLCAALGGRSPFSRDTTLATLHAVLYEEPELPATTGPLRDILAALLEKDPEVRPGLSDLEASLRPLAYPEPTPTVQVRGGVEAGPGEDSAGADPGPGSGSGSGSAEGSVSQTGSPGAADPEAGPEAGPAVPTGVPEASATPEESSAPWAAHAKGPQDPPEPPTSPEPPEATAPTSGDTRSLRVPRDLRGPAPEPEPESQPEPEAEPIQDAIPDPRPRPRPRPRQDLDPLPAPPTPLAEPSPPSAHPLNASTEAVSEGRSETRSQIPSGTSERTVPGTGTGVSLTRAEAETESRPGPVPALTPTPGRTPDAPFSLGPHPLNPPAGELPGPAVPARTPRRGTRRTALIAAVGVVTAGAVVAIVLAATAGSPDDTRAGSSPSASQPASSATGGSPSPTVEGTSRPQSLPPGAHREAGGFAWATPEGWRRDVKTGAEVHYTSPDGKQELAAKSALARGDLMETWETSEQNARQGQDYRKLRLERTTFRGQEAVVWEYTFTLKGVAWHAQLLGFNENGKSYQINTWYQPDVEEQALKTYGEVRDSFTVL